MDLRLVTFGRGRTIPLARVIHPLSALETMEKLLERTKQKCRAGANESDILRKQALRLNATQLLSSFCEKEGEAADVLDHFMLSCHLYELFRCERPISVGTLPNQFRALVEVDSAHEREDFGYAAVWFCDHAKDIVDQEAKAILFAFCCKTRCCRKKYAFSSQPEPVALSKKRKSWKWFDTAINAYAIIVAFHRDLSQNFMRHAVKGYFSQQYSNNDGVYVFSRKPRSVLGALMQWTNHSLAKDVAEFLDGPGCAFVGTFIVTLFERDMTEAELIMGWQYLTFSRQIETTSIEEGEQVVRVREGEDDEQVERPYINQSQARARLNAVVAAARKHKKQKREAKDSHGIFSSDFDCK